MLTLALHVNSLSYERPRDATARALDQKEADRTLAAYRSRHPRAWQRMRLVLEETLGAPITDINTPLPMVELRLD